MSCGAPNFLFANQSTLPRHSISDLTVEQTTNHDFELDLNLLNKYFQVSTLDETLDHRRDEFKTRREQLQKRHEALHDREIALKERILSYEMYIKELAMKRDRALRRIDDEKNLIGKKKIEIDTLHKEIQRRQEEKEKIEHILAQYQPHWNLLAQMVDQTDRFQSIDEMIEKFEMLFASYQDILTTIQDSNRQFDELQRDLLLTVEKNKNQILLMQNRSAELHDQHWQIEQRIDRIQLEIGNYRQMSVENSTEFGALNIAIDSMCELVRKFGRHRGKIPECSSRDLSCLLNQLKQIDVFLGDLTSYVDYVQSRSPSQTGIHRTTLPAIQSEKIIKNEDTPRWREGCENNQIEVSIKTIDPTQSSLSYQIRGDDNRFYTIEMTRLKKKSSHSRRPSQPRPSSSSLSVTSPSKESHSKGKKIVSSPPYHINIDLSKKSPKNNRNLRAKSNLFSEENRIPFTGIEDI